VIATARAADNFAFPGRERARTPRRSALSSAPAMTTPADILPPELTAIRAVGLVLAAVVAGYAIWRRRELRNADVLILLLVALGLAIVAGTEIPDALLEAFSFERENGTRIVGVAVFAILVLFLLTLRALAQSSRVSRQLGGALEGLAWEEFRAAGNPERFRDRIAILIPAYDEADNLGRVLEQVPSEVCGVPTAVLVVDDGSRDGTDRVARSHGAVVARHVVNRGGGAALRTGYRLLSDAGAQIVVTIDADGQHLPEEMPCLVQPVLDGEVAVAHGSRVLGKAEPNHPAREAGIVFFNRLVSLVTRTHVTDCSNGYRAVRADVLPTLVLRQEQFHTSEFMIEAIKRGIPAKEVPVTVVNRLSGHSKKPAVVRYGMGFANAIVRTWLR
jgi:Glycosyl transferase family 2